MKTQEILKKDSNLLGKKEKKMKARPKKLTGVTAAAEQSQEEKNKK